jgi:hypothetical protein
MAPRYKSFVARIKLALHPKRPDPVSVRLYGYCVQETTKVHLQTQADQAFGDSFSIAEAYLGDGIE